MRRKWEILFLQKSLIPHLRIVNRIFSPGCSPCFPPLAILFSIHIKAGGFLYFYAFVLKVLDPIYSTKQVRGVWNWKHALIIISVVKYSFEFLCCFSEDKESLTRQPEQAPSFFQRCCLEGSGLFDTVMDGKCIKRCSVYISDRRGRPVWRTWHKKVQSSPIFLYSFFVHFFQIYRLCLSTNPTATCGGRGMHFVAVY